MYHVKLIARHHLQKKSLNSKVENLTKGVENNKVVGQLLAFIFKFLILTFFGLLILFPFYFMISQSLISSDAANRKDIIIWYPRNGESAQFKAHWDNFAKAYQEGYWSAVVFTAAITAFSVTCRIFFAMTFGYAFSLRKWRFKNFSWGFFLALLVLPETALMAGQYKVIVTMGLNANQGTFVALTIPFAASVFSGFMFRNAFEAIPDSVRESSMIDGANELKFFVRVAVPMVKSTIWTVVILTALASWNSFMWPQLILGAKGQGSYTVMNVWLFTTGKDDSSEQSIIYRNIRMAANVLVILPMLVVYFLFRGRIMRAISRQGSGQKG
ncbi:carbohydrate ABC transporter permease [Mycoplasma sp. 128]|uniref:carbohydrate ABC transporter permease n=1 Tax=Mycoplasma sp. 3341 TaxID=3447506 RepID=UPI003F65A3C9